MIENNSDSPNPYAVSSKDHSTLTKQSGGLVYDFATWFAGSVALIAIEVALIFIARGRFSSIDEILLRLSVLSVLYLLVGLAAVLSLKKFNRISLVCCILLASLVLLITLANFAMYRILSGPLV